MPARHLSTDISQTFRSSPIFLPRSLPALSALRIPHAIGTWRRGFAQTLQTIRLTSPRHRNGNAERRPELRDPSLWNRLQACHPDDVEADFPFSARLARDNGWSKSFAGRVVVEYLRFAYLSRLGEGIVTPSDEVDQAWHLHLTYTRHYWGPFKEAKINDFLVVFQGF